MAVRSPFRHSALIVLLLLLLARTRNASAHAGPGTATPDAPVPTAEVLFQKGITAYDGGDYVAAIAAFRTAYEMSHAPEILFDIGQAHGMLGNCRQALDSFGAFIAATTSDDPLLPRARTRQEELRDCQAQDARKISERRPADPPAPLSVRVPDPGPAVAPVPLVAQPGPAPAGQNHSLMRAGCFSTAGAGVVLGGGSAVFLILARRQQEIVDSGTEWNETARSADERGRTYQGIATTLLVTAGVSAAAAVATCWLGWR